jgi:hypothetical protein
MIGAGWWLVRKAGGRGGITYTVPEREITATRQKLALAKPSDAP